MEMSALESPSKNQRSSTVNMKSTICHDFPSPDLLEGWKDGKIKENAKFFFILKSSNKVYNIITLNYWSWNLIMVCLIFHTAIIINRKNWRITIKLHFENFKKSKCTYMLGPPLILFVFVHLFALM